MRLAAQFAPWRRAVEFYLIEERPVVDSPSPKPHLLEPGPDETSMVWERKEEGFIWSRPSFQLTEQRAQELFEMLWAGGMRPMTQVNEAARIDAVTRHLEDMRAIAFDRLKVGAPSQR